MTAPKNEQSRLRALSEQAGRDLDGAGPKEVLRWADRAFSPGLAIASSMADAVLAHLAVEGQDDDQGARLYERNPDL